MPSPQPRSLTAVNRRPTRAFALLALAAAVASCISSTAPTVAAGPPRDLAAQIQTDTTIYHAALQGSQWVIKGSTRWTIPNTLAQHFQPDTAFAYTPCHQEALDAIVSVERTTGDSTPTAFAQASGCGPSALRVIVNGQSLTLYFTISAPASAAVSDRTGRMRIRFVLCSLDAICHPIPPANTPISNVFEVRP